VLCTSSEAMLNKHDAILGNKRSTSALGFIFLRSGGCRLLRAKSGNQAGSPYRSRLERQLPLPGYDYISLQAGFSNLGWHRHGLPNQHLQSLSPVQLYNCLEYTG
jgi:hypothetical protein